MAKAPPLHYHRNRGLHWKVKLRHLVVETDDFIIGLDDEWDLDWEATDPFFPSLMEAAKVDWGKSMARLASVQAIPTDYLRLEHKKNFNIMLGEGLARALERNFADALTMFDKAEAVLCTRNQEIARVWCLKASSLTAFCIMVLIVCAYCVLPESWRTSTLFQLLLCCTAGAIGALVSVFLRAAKLPLDPAAGPIPHYWDASGRIMAGFIGGGCISLASKLEIVLPQLARSGTWGLVFAGLFAGASERILPSLIKRLESEATESEATEPKRTAH